MPSDAILDAAFTHLTNAGMISDRTLMGMIDTSAITLGDGGQVSIPRNFVAGVKATKPHLFRWPTGATLFDARTAPAAEVEARLKDMEREAFRNRQAAHTAAVVASLGGR